MSFNIRRRKKIRCWQRNACKNFMSPIGKAPMDNCSIMHGWKNYEYDVVN